MIGSWIDHRGYGSKDWNSNKYLSAYSESECIHPLSASRIYPSCLLSQMSLSSPVLSYPTSYLIPHTSLSHVIIQSIVTTFPLYYNPSVLAIYSSTLPILTTVPTVKIIVFLHIVNPFFKPSILNLTHSLSSPSSSAIPSVWPRYNLRIWNTNTTL